MYRQILVDPEDRSLQKILWRHDDQITPRTYELNTVTYGLACAPFLAVHSLRQLADDEEARFPHGSAVLRRDVYVDDILTGAPTIEEAMDLQRQLTKLCTAGGFPLRKWSANDPVCWRALRQSTGLSATCCPGRRRRATPLLASTGTRTGTVFSFSTRFLTVAAYTKRSVLSLTARLFDPLGWLAPTVIRAKVMFQSTWLRGATWDTPLEEANAQQWSTFERDFPRLEEIRVERRVPVCDAYAKVELHGFADASERAYAAVVYSRTEDHQGGISISLIAAKTRVAPLKTVSLPRLELCAASLLTKLVAHLRQVLGAEDVPIHLWSDSTVALGWIRGHPSRWTVYVANRVAEIQTALPGACWHHLPGKENPADCASRGISPSELVHHLLWWKGPLWLSEDRTSWPSSREEQPTGNMPEKTRQRARGCCATTRDD
ncbi:hypothetical protein ACFW04_013197 [Cataglyphis niger]